MFRKIFLLSAVILLAFPAWAFSFQGYVQTVGEGGTIAWGSGEISVVRSLTTEEEGEAVELTPLSVRRAASGARRQMLDIIMSVRIDAKRTVSAYLSDDDELAARVRGVIQNSPMERPAMFEDGGEVRVSEAFRGKLAELVYPTTIQFQSGIPPKLSTFMEQNLAYDTESPEFVGAGASGYTGVIIDARGLKITPALAPVIYGQDGIGAYGAFLVNREVAIAKGIVTYAVTSAPAVLKERVGLRPLAVKALNSFGSWRTDVIIPTSMARLVRTIMRSGDAMENSRIVIVIDAPEPLLKDGVDAETADTGVVTEPHEESLPAEEQS